jgi:ElaB/YqjD/DUF883 family membrane-anchored ribosome-binding protein
MADGYFSSLRHRAEDVRDSAESYGRRASGSLRDTGERLRDRGGDARTELSRLWSQLEDLVERRISPAAQDAARYAGGYAREGRDVAMDMASHLRDATRSRPLMAIGIAVAATWLISGMLRSKR